MDSLMRSINRTHRCSNRYQSEKLKADGISGNQQIYIFQICRHPGISQEQLSQRIAVNKSNVTRQLSALEQNGFITRRCSPEDRRMMQVFPTEKAEALYPKVVELMKNWNLLLLEDFTPEEREQLLEMMQRVQKKALQLAEEEEQKR